MALQLAQNHMIHGLHFEGNEGRVDSLGFLVAQPFHQQSPRSGDKLIVPNPLGSLRPLFEGTSTRVNLNKSPVMTEKASIEALDTGKVNFARDTCCWICEGWLEKYFRVNLYSVYPDIVLEDDTSLFHYNVFIHFDFDDWQPDVT